jgi:protein SCO1/2/putative membrane protein
MNNHSSQFEIFNFQFSFFNPLVQRRRQSRAPRSSAFLGLLAALALFGQTAAHAQEPKSLWDLAGVEDFSLTECHGQTVTKADLLGKPWLACFIFTRCAGADYCPRVSREMEILQQRLKGVDVRLVTITVDPENDTPEVLCEYAARYKADPEKWWFLTGDKETIYHLIRHSFRMIVYEDPKQIPGFEVAHSLEIMHVDAEGVVRGRYKAPSDVDMAKLRRVLLGKSDASDARLISEHAEEEKRKQLALEMATRETAAADAFAQVPAWVLRLPAVNASLNGLATVLLVAGWALIKSGMPRAHKTVMLTAFGVSMAFLACYLTYHQQLQHYTGSGSRKFDGAGPIRGSGGARPFSGLGDDLPRPHQSARAPQETGPPHLPDLALRVDHRSYNLLCSVPLAGAAGRTLILNAPRIEKLSVRLPGDWRHVAALGRGPGVPHVQPVDRRRRPLAARLHVQHHFHADDAGGRLHGNRRSDLHAVPQGDCRMRGQRRVGPDRRAGPDARSVPPTFVVLPRAIGETVFRGARVN